MAPLQNNVVHVSPYLRGWRRGHPKGLRVAGDGFFEGFQAESELVFEHALDLTGGSALMFGQKSWQFGQLKRTVKITKNKLSTN